MRDSRTKAHITVLLITLAELNLILLHTQHNSKKTQLEQYNAPIDSC